MGADKGSFPKAKKVDKGEAQDVQYESARLHNRLAAEEGKGHIWDGMVVPADACH